MALSAADRIGPPGGARIAVVGAAGGIGRALVHALLAGGCAVVALDLPASLERGALPDAVAAHPLDATDADAVAAAFAAVAKEAEGLDGFVHLAGFTAPRARVEETDEATWHEVMDGNLSSAFLCARAALPLLRRGSRSCSAVFTSSGLGVKPAPGYGPYAASKAGLIALVRLLAAEAAPDVRVNAVAPAAVDTPFLTGGTGRAAAEGLRFDRAAYERTVPLARMAEPEDVAAAILFLLGPAASYLTGQTLHVNGGLLMP